MSEIHLHFGVKKRTWFTLCVLLQFESSPQRQKNTDYQPIINNVFTTITISFLLFTGLNPKVHHPRAEWISFVLVWLQGF